MPGTVGVRVLVGDGVVDGVGDEVVVLVWVKDGDGDWVDALVGEGFGAAVPVPVPVGTLAVTVVVIGDVVPARIVVGVQDDLCVPVALGAGV